MKQRRRAPTPATWKGKRRASNGNVNNASNTTRRGKPTQMNIGIDEDECSSILPVKEEWMDDESIQEYYDRCYNSTDHGSINRNSSIDEYYGDKDDDTSSYSDGESTFTGQSSTQFGGGNTIADMVCESRLQVDFAEKTAKEMEEVMKWYDEGKIYDPQNTSLSNNSLITRSPPERPRSKVKTSEAGQQSPSSLLSKPMKHKDDDNDDDEPNSDGVVGNDNSDDTNNDNDDGDSPDSPVHDHYLESFEGPSFSKEVQKQFAVVNQLCNNTEYMAMVINSLSFESHEQPTKSLPLPEMVEKVETSDEAQKQQAEVDMLCTNTKFMEETIADLVETSDDDDGQNNVLDTVLDVIVPDYIMTWQDKIGILVSRCFHLILTKTVPILLRILPLEVVQWSSNMQLSLGTKKVVLIYVTSFVVIPLLTYFIFLPANPRKQLVWYEQSLKNKPYFESTMHYIIQSYTPSNNGSQVYGEMPSFELYFFP